MADNSTKSFPTIPAKHWWAVRDLFKKSMPKTVDPKYLASALDMSEIAAKTNVAPALRATGIIDENGTPTQRAIEWRDDVSYPEVCKTVLGEVYPRQLRDLVSDPKSDRGAAVRWFANTTGSGENAVGKMVSLFLLLIEADPQKKVTPYRSSTTKKRKATATTPQAKPKKHDEQEPSRESMQVDQTIRGPSPEIHLNLQIHLSPDATPKQIDSVFESMARHLKTLNQ